MSKPGKSLKALCKRLGVRLTIKRGKKRVYKSVKVLKEQCKRKKKKKKRKRKRRFGTSGTDLNMTGNTLSQNSQGTYYGQYIDGKRHGLGGMRYNDGNFYIGMWKNDKKNDLC